MPPGMYCSKSCSRSCLRRRTPFVMMRLPAVGHLPDVGTLGARREGVDAADVSERALKEIAQVRHVGQS